MPRTKISEFSATPANNTDIDSINISEGCAPSGINDAIRELMAQLKDFQTGAVGDSFNGPVGTSTAAAGAFTTLSASSTVSGTGFSTYLASPPAIGGTAAAAGAFTTLAASGAVTLSGGTANGVAYLNGSKVVTSGSALTFDGSYFTAGSGTGTFLADIVQVSGTATKVNASGVGLELRGSTAPSITAYNRTTSAYLPFTLDTSASIFSISGSEQMRLTSTGLGVGTSIISGFYGSSSVATRGVFAYTSSSTNCDTAPKGLVIRNDDTTTGNLSQLVFGSLNTGNTPIASASIWSINDARSSGFSTGSLAFGTVGGSGVISERMRLDSSGNLGLGVTPSAWASFYRGFDLSTYSAVYGATTNNAGLINNGYFNGSNWIYKNTASASNYSQSGGTHNWFTAASGTAGNAITFTQAMTLDASGNLGIGTTSPATKLHINGAITSGVLGASGSYAVTYNPDTSGNAVFWTKSDGYFAIGTGANPYSGGTERVRIDSSGNLDLTGGGTFSSIGVYNNTTASAANVHVSSAGGLFFRSTSALKYKQDIRNLESMDIGLLRPVRYKSKCEGDDQTKDHLGLIADEAAEAGFEELVTRGENGEVESFQYERLTVVLLKELQTLRQRVAQLEAQ